MRGMKRIDSPQMMTAQINHNYIMPHDGPDGITPAEAAGIHMHGDDKWLVLLEITAYWKRHPPDFF